MLLLSSDPDQLVSSQCSRAIASVWQRPLVLHPFAGHDLPLDDPQWAADQVAQSPKDSGRAQACLNPT